jgi:hypothetical protein
VCWRDVTSFVGAVRGVPVFKGNVACCCGFSMTCSLGLQRAWFRNASALCSVLNYSPLYAIVIYYIPICLICESFDA